VELEAIAFRDGLKGSKYPKASDGIDIFPRHSAHPRAAQWLILLSSQNSSAGMKPLQQRIAGLTRTTGPISGK
jgi:hypothetical protein